MTSRHLLLYRRLTLSRTTNEDKRAAAALPLPPSTLFPMRQTLGSLRLARLCAFSPKSLQERSRLLPMAKEKLLHSPDEHDARTQITATTEQQAQHHQ